VQQCFFSQIGEIASKNVGVTLGFTVIDNVAVMAQIQFVVKYTFDCSTLQDSSSKIPLVEVVGKIGAVAFAQN
jgi:hypothetical protein